VVAGRVGSERSTEQDYLTRAAAAGLVWPLPPDLTNQALAQLLFPDPQSRPGARRYVEPDWPVLVREMKRPGVNLSDFAGRRRLDDHLSRGFNLMVAITVNSASRIV
jgi:transposase